MNHKSPCLTCVRVKDPANCEAKTCKDWQAWFIDRWESMREQVRKEMEAADLQQAGVPLGGILYAHPDQVQAYLDTDPCDRCLCPKNVCTHPCPVKIMWLDKKSGVRE